jgi:4-hydroxybenzoate polyprenyltransferase
MSSSAHVPAELTEPPPTPAPSGASALLLLLFMPVVAAWDVLAVQLYLGDRIRPLTMLMVGALALFVYALNGLTDAAEDGVNDAVRAAALRRHAFWTLGSATSVLLVVGSALWGRGELHPLYLLLSAIGVAYSIRVLPWPTKRGLEWVRLKDIAFVKNLTIASTWAAAVFVAPLLDVGVAAARPGVLTLVGLGYAALLLVNSIYSDMRDEAGDRQASVSTLPVRFGASSCHRGIFIAMSVWATVLLWCLVSRVIDIRHFLLLSAAALVYPLTVWLVTERWGFNRTASNCVIELGDFLFALGLMMLAIS